MHEQVFTDPQVKRALSEAYVLARVDYDSDEAKPFMERNGVRGFRSEEHTPELPSLMRRSYAVFCSEKKIASAHYNLVHTNVCHAVPQSQPERVIILLYNQQQYKYIHKK